MLNELSNQNRVVELWQITALIIGLSSRCWKLIIGFDHVIFNVLRLLPLNFFLIGLRNQLRYRYWPHHRVDCNKEKITFTDFFFSQVALFTANADNFGTSGMGTCVNHFSSYF